jgi:hypothetical protein
VVDPTAAAAAASAVQRLVRPWEQQARHTCQSGVGMLPSGRPEVQLFPALGRL